MICTICVEPMEVGQELTRFDGCPVMVPEQCFHTACYEWAMNAELKEVEWSDEESEAA